MSPTRRSRAPIGASCICAPRGGSRASRVMAAPPTCWPTTTRGRSNSSRPPSRSKAAVLHELARVTALAGSDDAVASATEALAAATAAGERDLMARSMNTLGVARTSAGDEGGLEDLRRSLELAKEVQSPLDICRGYINLCATTSNIGDLRTAYELHLEGFEVARRFELGPQTRWFSGEQCELDYTAGRWDEAIAAIDRF